MIKLVVSDIDGTLIEEGTSQINPEYFEVIHELRKKGIQFVAASGRQYASMRHVFEPVAEEMIFVSENGTNLIQNDKVSASIFMDSEISAEVIRYARQIPNCDIMLCTPDMQYLEQPNEKLLNWLLYGYHSQAKVIDDLMEQIHQVNKISFYREGGASAIGPQVIERFGTDLDVAVSGSAWIDIMERGTNKGTAVKKLQQRLRIYPEETIVFGDNCNDLSMFECADETYAVETAHQELIAAARHVIPSPDKNGVLEVLKELLNK